MAKKLKRLKSGAKPDTRGGKREGSGRKPNWLTEKCKELVETHDLMGYLVRIASGKEMEEVATKDGPVRVEIGARDRMHAIEILLGRGFGKAIQGVEVSGEGGGPIQWNVTVKLVQNA